MLRLHRSQLLIPHHLRLLTTSTPPPPPPPPAAAEAELTVSYLTTACGLPLPAAISAAAKLHLKSTDNADAVLSLLKSHNFTPTQIASLISRRPRLLSADPNKVLRPKLAFFLSAAASAAVPSPTKLITADPDLLLVSLHKRLVPNLASLRSLLPHAPSVALALRRSSRLLRCHLDKSLIPNLDTLRRHGVAPDKLTRLVTLDPRVLMQSADQFGTTVDLLKKLGLPGSKIMKLAAMYPRMLMQGPDGFEGRIKTLKEQGFDPTSSLFVIGLYVISGLSAATWERKMAVYRSLGWSEKETILAFTKHPFCMLLSDEKIRRAMDFFVNKLNWEPSYLSARPKVLSLSLEKRIMPRCAVLSVLSSKGLMPKNLGVHTFLMFTEKKFVEQYIIKYREKVPEVLEAYQGKLGFTSIDYKK